MLETHISRELTVAASEYVKEGEYWMKKLSGELVNVSFPYDRFHASGVEEISMQSMEITISRDVCERLMNISKGGDYTLHILLVAGIILLLHRYTGQQDIIVGAPIYKQEIEGEFVNTVLALRGVIDGSMTFKEFLMQVRQTVLEANENLNYPLETLLYRLNIPLSGTGIPLFDVVVLLENIHDKKYIEHIRPNVIFSFLRTGQALTGKVEFNSFWYESSSMARIAAHLDALLRHTLFHVDLPLAGIDFLSEQEQREQLVDFNQTRAAYPQDRTIHELIEQQVELAPDGLAVMSQGSGLTLTYRQLEERANQLAHYLISGNGIRPGDRVGILMDNSPELVFTILGILKAGAAYVPMDPVLPEERLKRIIDDASLRVVISLKKHLRTLNRLQWECFSFQTFLCLDTRDIYAEGEREKSELMDEKLWDYVAETADDEVTGGGWNSSYTGEPISKQEMDEYGDNVLKKLLPILHSDMRVLEIGCASGITMYRIAPRVAYYHGTDLSNGMIRLNRERVKREDIKNIALACLPAHRIDALEDRGFDLIILNSVIQSFHGHNYLRKVLDKAVELIGERGYIFIGDIMDHDLKKELIADLVEFKRLNRDKDIQTKTDFSTELFVARGFFQDLGKDKPEITGMEFSGKIHSVANELTRYRYDTLITIDKTVKTGIKSGNRCGRGNKRKYQEDVHVLEGYETGKAAPVITAGHPAYIIYTSGTTGMPRGVMIEHRSLVNYIWWAAKTYNSGRARSVLVPLYSSISFDLTVTSVFLPLLTGGTIVIYSSDDHRFPVQQIVKEDSVDIIKATPSHLKLLQHEITGDNKKLKTFIVGGEELERSLAQEIYLGFSRRVSIYNEYGPTEATVGCMIYKFNYEKDRRRSVSIGKPADNVSIYILDQSMNPVPVNGTGELYIGGAALARGYVNQPEQTHEKFTNKKFFRGPGGGFTKKPPGRRRQKLYKTGDLARRLADGNIEFLGRVDQQVKIRGYRIELKEIESQLLTHSEVKEAVVIARETAQSESGEGIADRALCAYIVPEKSIETSALIAYLSVLLPDYMIPSYFMIVERIPLTANGKVDIRALPEPKIEGTDGKYAAPENRVQVTLVEIWSKVLSIEKSIIGIDTNFFELGGHSLKATILIAEIHKALHVKVPLAEIFKHPFIRELADYIERTAAEEFTHIQPAEKKEYYVLSSAQKRHYIIQQLELSGMGYNETIFSMLEGKIEKEHFEQTFWKIIRRHESFRTSFHIVKDEPVQRVFDPADVEFAIEYYDLTAGAGAGVDGNRQGKADRKEVERITAGFVRPFELNRAPLLRVGLVREDEEKHVLMVDMHHIVTDGTSMGLLRKEFMDLYNGEEQVLLQIQYKDFSEWQNSRAIRESMQQQEKYWLKAFEGEIPVVEFPMDFPRPAEKGFEGTALEFVLETDVSAAIRELARQEEATMYMLLLAAFNVLLYKLSSSEDIIVGTPIAGRRHADLQPIIGMFVNTLAMRNYPRGQRTFTDFLKEVKIRTLEAFENQDYQFEELVERLQVPRDTSRNPIFEVMFAVQNMETPSVEIPKLRLLPYYHEDPATPFDLTLHSHVLGQRIMFTLEYSTRLFLPATIRRVADYFKKVLASVSRDPGQRIVEIDLLSEEEMNRVLYHFNDTAEEFLPGKTIPQLFEEQVEKTPHRVALTGPPLHRAITYDELNRKSNRLAYFLRHTGVGPDNVVGLMVERSFEMILGLLAILKAGAAYLPMDTEYPEDRILLMLSDSRAPVLLTQEKMLNRFSITSLKGMKADRRGLVVTPPQAQIKDFDRLPKPDRSLVNYEKYHQSIGVAMGKHTVSIQATRGCPFNCLFCHKIWPKTHVTRSAPGIIDEIRCCYEAGVKRFVFIDDIFNLDKRNSAEVFAGIIKEGMHLQMFFPNGLRGDILDKDFIDLMAEAGTVSMSMALESACPRIQKLINKNLNLEKFEGIVRYIIETYPQIILEMGLMLGFPTETEEEALMTLEFLERLKWVHFPNLHILKIYPNTDMFKLARQHGVSEALIQRSANLAYHQLPETLPYPKHFVRQYQTRFMNGYFLSKERMLDVLPLQARTLSIDEFIQKYNSYLPMEIKEFSDILDCAGISKEELGGLELLPANYMAAPDFNNKIKKHFPPYPVSENPFKVLLLDLSLFFSARQAQEGNLYDMVDAPLGLMYLLTFLNEKFKSWVQGKIAKSRIDFDDFEGLKTLITEFKPDVIGIRTLSFFKEFFHQTVLLIRKWGIRVPIIAGGPYATSDFSFILQDDNVDLVVLGEGEMVFSQLVEKMMENNRQLPEEEVLEGIPGLAFIKDKFRKSTIENVLPGESRSREIVLMDEISRGMGHHRYPGANLPHINRDSDMLYVIYTSGSTGKPKAVILEHRNLVNLMNYTFKHTPIDCSSVLQFATISFDVSFQEIFSTLLSGGKLVLIDSKTRGDVPELFKLVEKSRIRTLFLPTSFLKFIFNEADYVGLIPPGIRHLVTAGEQLLISDLLRVYMKRNNVYLHNHYGPSETHVVTALTLDPQGEIPQRPSIGRPISNTGIYILGQGNQVPPQGVAGELCIGGIQVGRGYLGKAELANEKFIDNPFIQGERLYNTGDLARWLPDGTIEFLGRVDLQVKIRGFRVEPGEIETRLKTYEDIKDAVVVTKEDKKGENYLCAYIVPLEPAGEHTDRTPDIKGLREFLSQTLPDYMIPAYFIHLDKIPLTPNGKLNLRALPEPEALGKGENYIAPAGELEEKLAGIWAEVLNISESVLGVEDNFFQLGGHSLKATILVSRIHKNLGVKVPLVQMFKTPSIKGLAGYIQKAEPGKFVSIVPVEKKEYYLLSPAQKRLYILQQLDLASTAYNLLFQVYLDLGKEVLVGKLEEIFKRLIARHESLRTSFRIINEEPLQVIHKDVEFKIDYFDITGKADAAEHDSSGVIHGFVRPFDLARAPLFRVGLLKTGERHHTLLIDMHHIVTDGISQDLLFEEFKLLYWNRAERLAELRLQYKDYALWQVLTDNQEFIKKQEAYWINMFSGPLPVLSLATDFPRPMIQSFEGRTVYFVLGEEETGNLRKPAEENNATLYMSILAVFSILLAKLSGQEDIVVGTPIAARRHADLHGIVGMFVNTLAMRNFPQPDKTYAEFLGDVRVRTLEAFENQEYQFEDLVDKVSVHRDTGRNPIFDIMFGLWSQVEYRKDLPDIKGSALRHIESTAKFDISFTVIEQGNELFCNLEYASRLFSAGTIERIIGYFKKISAAVAAEPDKRLADIELITAAERKQILFDFNDTAAEYAQDKTIHELFAAQAEITPDHIALVAGEGSNKTGDVYLTYRELQEKSGILARWLMEAGIGADMMVGVMAERSVEMIIAIFGILQAGGAYLPIDPHYPAERINYMLADGEVRILLTAAKAPVLVDPDKIEAVDLFTFFTGSSSSIAPSCESSLPGRVGPGNLVYVIYTSGTTGNPKGTMIRHYSLVNRLNWMQGQYRIGCNDVLLQKTPYTFDVSVWEIFWWSLTGAGLCILEPGGEKDPAIIVNRIERNRISVIHFVPSMLSVFIDYLDAAGQVRRLSGLKQVIASGEALTVQQVEMFNRVIYSRNRTKLANLYGPTEATVDVSYYNCPGEEEILKIPIGKPIDNIALLIFNHNGHLQPLGVVGELTITGIGLARGYLNNPELTAQKFQPMPDRIIRSFYGGATGSRLYKTGDLARWLADGNIEFSGRVDSQVKIRGNRVELAEIETRLLRYSKVKEAVVTAMSSENREADRYLCAYIVADDVIPALELREFLASQVPEFMVPSYFMPVERIPLTANGKVDRKSLPDPVQAGLTARKERRAPSGELEERLVGIWAEVLNIEREAIGIDDNFFEMGGHSLKAIRMVTLIHKKLNVKVVLMEIFNRATIRRLSGYIRGLVENRYASLDSVEDREYYPLSSAQKRLYFLQEVDPASTVYNMPTVVSLPGGVDKERYRQVFLSLIERHESLRTSFQMIGEQVVQRVYPAGEISFDMQYIVSNEPEAIIRQFIRPFDLAQVPLLRVGLIEVGEGRHVLMVDLHHIVSDGESQEILVQEFMALGRSEQLPEIKYRYRDFIGWRSEEGEGSMVARQGKYWLRRFGGEIPVLDMPTDFMRPSVQRFEGSIMGFAMARDISGALQHLAVREGVTLYMLLLSIYVIFLSKLSTQEDIIVGTPVTGRRHADLERVIGMFVNTLALRNYPCGEKSFIEFLHEVKAVALEAFENQDYPFEDLVGQVAVNRDAGRNPLFDTVFFLETLEGRKPGKAAQPGRSSLELFPYESRISKFDMTLVAFATGEQISFTIEYCTKLFKPETIERFAGYFRTIASTIVENPQGRLWEIDILSGQERHQLVNKLNGPQVGYPSAKTIHGIFAEQVRQTPDHVALLGQVSRPRSDGRLADAFRDAVSLTYHELNQQSLRLACRLQEMGVGPDTIVGIMVDRSIGIITGMLGILNAGGGYLPIDPDYPWDRVNYMLADSGAGVLITCKHLAQDVLPGIDVIYVDSNEFPGITAAREFSPAVSQPRHLAYVIYTSGTTGKPKGAMVTHRNVVRLFFTEAPLFDFNSNDVWTMFHSPCFDFSVWEMYGALLYGGRLIVVPYMVTRDPGEYLRILKEKGVTVLNQTPSAFYHLSEEEMNGEPGPMALRYVIFGGEALSPGRLKTWQERYPRVRLINMYGITETTVHVTYKELSAEEIDADISNIGQPIPTLSTYILDEYLRVLPPGIRGELCVSGAGVARGYLNRPELTHGKFVGNPFKPGENLYRSGDSGRIVNVAGDMEYLGRLDQQVKIRGFRIELGEIESLLQAYAGIKTAVVMARTMEASAAADDDNRGNKHLYAYFVAQQELTLTELRDYLSRYLPDYMVPSYFVRLDRVPLTANGKIDRKALDSYGRQLFLSSAYAAPQNEIEKKIADIWKEVLHLDKVGIHDNYFELGGTSLDILKINKRLAEIAQVKVPVVMMFIHPTVHSLADYLLHETAEVRDRSAALERGKQDKKQRLQKRRGIER